MKTLNNINEEDKLLRYLSINKYGIEKYNEFL